MNEKAVVPLNSSLIIPHSSFCLPSARPLRYTPTPPTKLHSIRPPLSEVALNLAHLQRSPNALHGGTSRRRFTMRCPSRKNVFFTALLVTLVALAPAATRAADFKREVIYQIITDRFFDGSTANN